MLIKQIKNDHSGIRINTRPIALYIMTRTQSSETYQTQFSK